MKSNAIINELSDMILTVPKAKSELELHLQDGRYEYFRLNSTCPVEFIISEPIVGEDETIINLEILKFEVETVSEILWPGETIKMSGGRKIGKESLPIYGKTHIPKGKELSDGVESVQEVYVEIDTPHGKLHNVQPVTMAGLITELPPTGVTFQTITNTPVYNDKFEKYGIFVACSSHVIES